MTRSEERLKILKMIDEGKITAEEGARLIKAINRQVRQGAAHGEETPRWLRVQVTDRISGKAVVNVNLPITLIDVGLKLGARFVPDLEGLQYDEFAAAVRMGRKGKILDMEDEEENQHVEVYLE
jgi:hypothetical protein